MLVEFRKLISKIPSGFFLAWIILFFSDAANLDELCSKSVILHSEIPVSIFENFSTGLHTNLECTNSSKQVNFKSVQKPSKIQNYIIDEDSPVISAEYGNNIQCIFYRIEKTTVLTDAYLSSTLLYLQNRSLLI